MNENESISGRYLKNEIALKYKISRSHLAYLLNVKYYQYLQPFDYVKTQKDLTPKQLEIFVEKYGEW